MCGLRCDPSQLIDVERGNEIADLGHPLFTGREDLHRGRVGVEIDNRGEGVAKRSVWRPVGIPRAVGLAHLPDEAIVDHDQVTKGLKERPLAMHLFVQLRLWQAAGSIHGVGPQILNGGPRGPHTIDVSGEEGRPSRVAAFKLGLDQRFNLDTVDHQPRDLSPDLGVHEVDAAELGVAEAHLLEPRAREVRIDQARSPEVGVDELLGRLGQHGRLGHGHEESGDGVEGLLHSLTVGRSFEAMGPDSRYDEFATWYDDWIAAPEDDPVARSLLTLVGDVKGQRLLDVACGGGRIARTLARDGAEVVGVDASSGLLSYAAKQPTDHITYIHADVTNVDWWDGNHFDGAVSSMALMDIDDLEGTIATAATTVRPGGWFAWSIIHPGFPGAGPVRPSWSAEGYFTEGWWNTGADGLRGRVGSNHRTLSTYLNTHVRHGFVLEAVDEPRWDPPEGGPSLPFFLVTRWRRS
jgi:2-polyprenyl-3-methyl-5-hydroxy-6-metoxy-1,4-benzoquinol methylase